VLVPQDQQIERSALTALDALDQLEVALFNAHRPTQTGKLSSQPVAIDRLLGEKFDGSRIVSTINVTWRTSRILAVVPQ
jgi:hypothetical protein